MVSRTREKLIEVASQLFAYKGVENTTMSDIANASDKGRRTIYTYFKSKREIYEATLESESDRMVHQLRQSIASVTTPVEKLICFLRYRLEMDDYHYRIRHLIGFDSLINLDFKPVKRVRHLTELKERDILQEIVNYGITEGVFDPNQSRRLLNIMAILRPMDDVNMDDEVAQGSDNHKEELLNFIVNSIIKQPIN